MVSQFWKEADHYGQIPSMREFDPHGDAVPTHTDVLPEVTSDEAIELDRSMRYWAEQQGISVLEIDTSSNLQRIKVPVTALFATQPARFGNTRSSGHPLVWPLTAGRYAILDGHHRAVGQILDGASSLEVLAPEMSVTRTAAFLREANKRLRGLQNLLGGVTLPIDGVRAADPEGRLGYLNWYVAAVRDAVTSGDLQFEPGERVIADGKPAAVVEGAGLSAQIRFEDGTEELVLAQDLRRVEPRYSDVPAAIKLATQLDQQFALLASLQERLQSYRGDFRVRLPTPDGFDSGEILATYLRGTVEPAIEHARQDWEKRPRKERAEYVRLSKDVTRLDNKDATCSLYGGSTDWCFAKWNQRAYEDTYNKDEGEIYVVRHDRENYAVFVDHDLDVREIKNANNDDVTSEVAAELIAKIEEATGSTLNYDEEDDFTGEDLAGWEAVGLDEYEWGEYFDDPHDAAYWEQEFPDPAEASAWKDVLGGSYRDQAAELVISGWTADDPMLAESFEAFNDNNLRMSRPNDQVEILQILDQKEAVEHAFTLQEEPSASFLALMAGARAGGRDLDLTAQFWRWAGGEGSLIGVKNLWRMGGAISDEDKRAWMASAPTGADVEDKAYLSGIGYATWRRIQKLVSSPRDRRAVSEWSRDFNLTADDAAAWWDEFKPYRGMVEAWLEVGVRDPKEAAKLRDQDITPRLYQDQQRSAVFWSVDAAINVVDEDPEAHKDIFWDTKQPGEAAPGQDIVFPAQPIESDPHGADPWASMRRREANRKLRRRMSPELYAIIEPAMRADEGAGTQYAQWFQAWARQFPEEARNPEELAQINSLIERVDAVRKELNVAPKLADRIQPLRSALERHTRSLEGQLQDRLDRKGRESDAAFNVISPNIVETLNFDAACFLHGTSSGKRIMPWCGGSRRQHFEIYADESKRRFIVYPEGPEYTVTINGERIPWSSYAFTVSVDFSDPENPQLYNINDPDNQYHERDKGFDVEGAQAALDLVAGHFGVDFSTALADAAPLVWEYAGLDVSDWQNFEGDVETAAALEEYGIRHGDLANLLLAQGAADNPVDLVSYQRGRYSPERVSLVPPKVAEASPAQQAAAAALIRRYDPPMDADFMRAVAEAIVYPEDVIAKFWPSPFFRELRYALKESVDNLQRVDEFIELMQRAEAAGLVDDYDSSFYDLVTEGQLAAMLDEHGTPEAVVQYYVDERDGLDELKDVLNDYLENREGLPPDHPSHEMVQSVLQRIRQHDPDYLAGPGEPFARQAYPQGNELGDLTEDDIASGEPTELNDFWRNTHESYHSDNQFEDADLKLGFVMISGSRIEFIQKFEDPEVNLPVVSIRREECMDKQAAPRPRYTIETEPDPLPTKWPRKSRRQEVSFRAVSPAGDKLGYVKLDMRRTRDGAPYARVIGSSVTSDLRRRGIGKALYKAALDFASQHGAWVRSDREVVDDMPNRPDHWTRDIAPELHREYRTAKRQPTACVDLDGTLLEDPDYENAEWMPSGQPPLSVAKHGASGAMRQLQEMGWKVIIFTARFSTAENVMQLDEMRKEVKEHLDQQRIPYDEIAVGSKPIADVYIDDRAHHFDGDWWETVKDLTKQAARLEAPPAMVEMGRVFLQKALAQFVVNKYERDLPNAQRFYRDELQNEILKGKRDLKRLRSVLSAMRRRATFQAPRTSYDVARTKYVVTRIGPDVFEYKRVHEWPHTGTTDVRESRRVTLEKIIGIIEYDLKYSIQSAESTARRVAEDPDLDPTGVDSSFLDLMRTQSSDIDSTLKQRVITFDLPVNLEGVAQEWMFQLLTERLPKSIEMRAIDAPNLSWKGRWSPDSKVLSVAFEHLPDRESQMQWALDDAMTTFKHELIHLLQTWMTEQRGGPYDLGSPQSRGRTDWSHDLPHAQRDVEYYANLTSDIENYVTYVRSTMEPDQYVDGYVPLDPESWFKTRSRSRELQNRPKGRGRMRLYQKAMSQFTQAVMQRLGDEVPRRKQAAMMEAPPAMVAQARPIIEAAVRDFARRRVETITALRSELPQMHLSEEQRQRLVEVASTEFDPEIQSLERTPLPRLPGTSHVRVSIPLDFEDSKHLDMFDPDVELPDDIILTIYNSADRMSRDREEGLASGAVGEYYNDGYVNLYVAPAVTVEDLEVQFDEMITAFEHELTHMLQFMSSSGEHIDRGLPRSRPAQSGEAAMNHAQLLVEFYPNLRTEVRDFEAWNRNNFTVTPEQWIRASERFNALRERSENLWRRAVREFYKEVSAGSERDAEGTGLALEGDPNDWTNATEDRTDLSIDPYGGRDQLKLAVAPPPTTRGFDPEENELNPERDFEVWETMERYASNPPHYFIHFGPGDKTGVTPDLSKITETTPVGLYVWELTPEMLETWASNSLLFSSSPWVSVVEPKGNIYQVGTPEDDKRVFEAISAHIEEVRTDALQQALDGAPPHVHSAILDFAARPESTNYKDRGSFWQILQAWRGPGLQAAGIDPSVDVVEFENLNPSQEAQAAWYDAAEAHAAWEEGPAQALLKVKKSEKWIEQAAGEGEAYRVMRDFFVNWDGRGTLHNPSRAPLSMTRFLQSLGYTGVYDPGNQISRREPGQAALFPGGYNVVDKFKNPTKSRTRYHDNLRRISLL